MDKDVGDLFALAEVRAERTIALVRVVVALLLGTIFVLAVIVHYPEEATAPWGRQIALAAATIGGYLGLGVLAYWVATPQRYRRWVAWAFATLDVAFVVVSVWLGLVNIAMPANYMIVMPVVWVVPIVLAFAAMRYSPLLQGYVAALMAAGLVLAAVYGGPWIDANAVPPPQTISFFFGTPPNVMRLLMLILAGLVLVIAVARTRRLLLRAIAETRRRANLTRYLPPAIADWLAETSLDELRRGRRQTVAVLFADIRGFCERAETMQPEALGAFVGAFRSRVAAAADTHGGLIDKFIGDAAMVVFGLPRTAPSDAAEAVRCGGAIFAEVAAWNVARQAAGEAPVEISIGAHWGEAFCGAIGDETRLEYTVLGDTVNVAARLEQEAAAGPVPFIVSGTLLEAAGDAAGDLPWAELEARVLRGRRHPVRIFGVAPPA